VTPARDAVELQVTRWALEADLPILAICRGVQVLNVAAGGTLWQDIATQIPGADKHDYHPNFPEDYRAHTVKTISGSRIAGIVGEDDVAVNSLHHQAIDRLGKGLHATAFAPDGIIEAIEGEGTGWVVGVQWHPEWLIGSDNRMRALFETFRNVCSVPNHPAMQSA
jgi:putative glutamine amidotransferase